MTTPTQAITADLGLDYNYARIVFIDRWDEALRAPVYQQKEWAGEGGAPVRFETSSVGLSIATNYPSVTVQVWAAEPPLSRQNPAGELWVGRFDGTLDTTHRTGFVNTILDGDTAHEVTVASDRTCVRVYVPDREQARRRFRPMDLPTDDDVPTPPSEFWLVQLWPA